MQRFTFFLSLTLLAACSAARDERLSTTTGSQAPVVRATIVDCSVYDGMTKTSAVLASTTSGSAGQVTDTINAYFVRVCLDKSGQTVTGYTDRRCFGEQGRKQVKSGELKVKNPYPLIQFQGR